MSIPNPIIVPLTVGTNDQPVNLRVESNDQFVPFSADEYIRPMPNITIGTVESGDEAEATMTGTADNPVLNLVLPKGDKGDKGDQGNPTVVNGKSGASITLTAADVGVFFDEVPTEGSSNAVKSNGVFDVFDNIRSDVNDLFAIVDEHSEHFETLEYDVGEMYLNKEDKTNKVTTLPQILQGDDTHYFSTGAVCSGFANVNRKFAEKQDISNMISSFNQQIGDREYPSANAVIDYVSHKQDQLTFDELPEQDSTNSVTSGGIYDAIEYAKQDVKQDVRQDIADVRTDIPTLTSELINDSDYTTGAATDAKLALKAASAGANANYAAKLTASIPYGKCDSTSTSTEFTATVPGITELKDGVCMLLYNGVVTSASGFTINVNGLGAKPSYSNMAMGNAITPTNPTRDTTIFNINYAFLFVYSETLVSGGCWIGYRGYDANTNTIGYQLRTNNTTMPTADKFYRYRLLFTSADGTKWVPANTSTSTNATAARTPNTRAIDPFGEIVWYGTTTAIEANANVTAGQLWQEYYGSYTNIGYSFNNTGAAQTMTANKPIYIVCTPQADGSAVIDPTTPYVQALPSTDDGKIYIYLGRAYNATNFEITMNHPVYYHDGTGIRLWNGVRNIPQAPTVDGTYVLKCTVNNGAVTYNWVLE